MKGVGKIVAVIALAEALAGCACVNVTAEERERIDELHEKDISWSGEKSEGRFEPPVNMVAAVAWSLLPGAGQHFIAHKMADYGYSDADVCLRGGQQLRSTGTLMIGVSWFPLVYCVTFPFGLSGVVTDVNRVNNLALLEWIEGQGLPVEVQQ